MDLIQSETREFMDQPSVQHERAVTIIPPAPHDSSIVSAGFQTWNLPSPVPREGVPTASAANTQARSRAPRQRRSRWNNPCSSGFTFDFCSTSIQTILLVVFLPVFRDEPAHGTLQIWVIGYGVGCLMDRAYKRFRVLQSNARLPQAVSVSPHSEVGESQISARQRFGFQILKWSWRLLDGFFELCFGVGTGIIFTRWTTGQAPHLSWLSTMFFVIGCFRFLLPSILLWCARRVLS